MADNRYSVDDILRELNENKRRIPEPTPQREVRRPAAPSLEADDDDFWEIKKPVRRAERPQRDDEQSPAAPTPRRPLREPPTGATESPRLGQNITAPRSREEMGRLLNRFDDSDQDPFGNLDFLEREPVIDYNNTPVKNFVPDWDQPPPQQRVSRREEPPQRVAREIPQQRVPRREEPPQRVAREIPQQRAPYRENPLQQPQSPSAGYREAPQQGARPYGEQPRLQQGGRREIPGMYRDDRRSMTSAAKLITSGGFDDDDNDFDTPPPQPPRRQQPRQPQLGQQSLLQQQPRQPAMQEPTYRGMPQATQPIPPIPRQGARPVSPPPPTRGAKQPFSDEVDVSRYEPRIDPRIEARIEAIDEPHEAVQGADVKNSDSKDTAKRGTNQQVAAQLGQMRVSLFVRVMVNLFAMIGVVYLALAGEYDFPLPGFITGAENMGTFLWTAVGMVIVSALVSGNTIGGGILALFKLRPSNDSYSALAVFACLVQGSYLAMQPQLMASYGDNLYLPMAALMLLFNTLGKLIMLTRTGSSFHFAAAKGEKHVAEIMDNREFARRISGDIVGEEPKIAYFTETTTVDSFLEQAFSESKAEDISKIVAPVTALAALIMALVSYLFSRDIFIAACVYTAALCITAPLAGVIASNLPLSITNGKLSRFGAALCGYEAVNRFADTNGVLLRCSQLFPKGSVSIQDIKVLDRRPIDQVITDAASVLCACDSNLSGIFRDMIQDSSMLHQPENLEYFDDMGLSAWVNGRRVLIGNRSLMMSYGVSIPGVEFERPYTVGNNEVMYLSNSGEAAAMYVLSYKADKQMRRAMELLCDRDMAVCIYSTDPNLTAEKISNIYNFPKELLSIIPASMQAGSEKYLLPKSKVAASVIHNGTPASYLRTILAAQSCSKCITLETALILMSVIIGFAIVTFFAFTRQMESLTWITIAVYQFFWLLLELTIPLVKH